MTDRQLLQQALDALWNVNDHQARHTAGIALIERLAHCDRCGKRLGGEGDIQTCTPKADPIGDAQDRLIVELAAQPEQKPVAWVHTMIDDVVIGHRPADLNSHPERWKPLVYVSTTPPAAAQPAPVQGKSYAADGQTELHTLSGVGLVVSAVAFNKLYTTPPAAQRKPLTDGEIKQALTSVDLETKRLPPGMRAFARAIEAAHGIKEKNNG
jgi:hypothetical protein